MFNISIGSFKILLTLIMLVFFTGLMISTTMQSLWELKKITGEVVESGTTIIKNSKGRTSNVYTIRLNALDLNFGIKEFDGDLYEYFLTNDPKGKELTIYYDPTGQYVSDNLTLHVGQVELGQEILLSFEDSKALYYIGALFFTILIFITIPIYIWVLRMERRKSKK